MEKEEIVIEEPVAIGEYVIMPITRKSVRCEDNEEGSIFIGVKHPLAMLLTTGSKKVLYIIESGICTEKFTEELPELRKPSLQIIRVA